jgi:formyltetrahydrofolate-dependent phosphoribosylglycinamide formyltransferase
MPVSFVSSWSDIAAWRDELDAEGKRLVLTNGVFDVLHVGHLRYLAEAAQLGHGLVVAINGDESVRAVKGPSRPINSSADRAELLCGLRCVDRVLVFDEPRATKVIGAIRPHIYTKGGDYTPESLIDEEKSLLDQLGTEIRILSLVPGKSTSATLKQMAAGDVSSEGHRIPRIAILGSGEGSNARAIIAAARRGVLGGEVALILGDVAEAGIFRVAEEQGIASLVLNPGTDRPGQLTDAAIKEMVDRLRAAEIDLVVLAGFMRILREPLLGHFRGRILNIHPSLLPRYPGRDAINRALVAGERETGCTVHLVNAGIDTGEILHQEVVPILPGDTHEALSARVHEAEHRVYAEVIARKLDELSGSPSNR